jgi:hypothetical protein
MPSGGKTNQAHFPRNLRKVVVALNPLVRKRTRGLCEYDTKAGGCSMKKILFLAVLMMVPVGVPAPLGEVQGQEG